MKKIPKILLLFALVFQLMGGFGQTVVKADDILLSDANLSLKVNVYVARCKSEFKSKCLCCR
jgi:hypothetical protein